MAFTFNLHSSIFKGSRVQGFKGSRVQGFKGSRVQGIDFNSKFKIVFSIVFTPYALRPVSSFCTLCHLFFNFQSSIFNLQFPSCDTGKKCTGKAILVINLRGASGFSLFKNSNETDTMRGKFPASSPLSESQLSSGSPSSLK